MKCSMGLWLLSLIVVLAIIAVTLQMLMARVHVSPRLAEALFKNFTIKYNKSYDSPEEYQKRLNIFTVSVFVVLHSGCCCCGRHRRCRHLSPMLVTACCRCMLIEYCAQFRKFHINLDYSNRWRTLFRKI